LPNAALRLEGADATVPDPRHYPLYLARRERLRQVMREAGVAAAVVLDPVSILYATGARNMTIWTSRTPARYLLVFADGPTILYDFFGCEHLARGLPTIDEIRPALGLCHWTSGGNAEAAGRQFAAEIDSVVREHLGPTREIAVDRFPFHSIDALRALGYRVFDADPVFARARAIKLPIELPYVREAMRRVEIAAADMAAQIEPGRTEAAVWGEFHRRFVGLEGHYVATRLLQSGPRTFPYFQECAGRVLRDGDLVCFDTDALGYQGYAVDFSRTFLCGGSGASDVQRTLHGRAREQLEWNIALIRPGASFEEIADAAWPVPDEHQKSRYYCVGHGLGLSGEFPNIPHRSPGHPYPLSGGVEPGMVICIESYIGSEAAGQGVKLEEQLLVSATGTERLSRFTFDERLSRHD
jgi:Xaa-Pro dipeptidase